MGGSRRRLKKTQAKVRVGVVKRTKIDKTKVPKALTENHPDIEKRLKKAATWEEQDTLTSNYEANNLILDANARFGRNASASAPLPSKEEKEARGEETYSDDDELRAACNLERKTGKAKPPRLTSNQRAVIAKLIEVHKDDVEAMVLDTKNNKMQHSAGQLKKLMTAYHYWGANSKHDFWGPQKPYKKL